MKIRWIHISDLHLKKNAGVETRLMHKQLPSYLAGLNLHCDYVFCTGDIREHSEPYTHEAVEYIRKISETVHVPLERLFIVPGNHDVNARAGGSYYIDGKEKVKRDDIINKLTDWQADYYDPKEGAISDADMEILSQGKADFINFISKLYPAERVSMYAKPHFVLQTDNLNVLHIDSALTYGISNTSNFIIGTGMLMDALEEIDQTKPTILLTHYSYDFLSQSERSEVEQLLYHYNVQLWIAGHEHENLCRHQRNKFYEFQCGNLELQKGAKSCFLLGELDLVTGEGIVTVHAWYPQSGWAPYPFARKNSENNRIYPFTLNLPGSDKTETDVSLTLQSAQESFAVLEEQGGDFYNVHLNTLILPDLECGSKLYTNSSFDMTDDKNETELPLHTVLAMMWKAKGDVSTVACNGLILGDGGMGKSTMMYHECRQKLYCEKTLSVYISLQSLESSEESIMHYVLRSLYKSIDDNAENKLMQLVLTRHSKPDLILFIDGFNELSKEASYQYIKEIRKFASFAGVQLVVSSRLDFLRDFGLSHFWMIRTCDLQEEQIHSLFADNEKEWANILARKNLRILLRNPMMALLYANTCPVMEQHQYQEYFEWKVPIKNASDLLYNYYLAQVVLMIERNSGNNYRDVFQCMVLIYYILPELGYIAESENVISWTADVFVSKLQKVIKSVVDEITVLMPARLYRIKRVYGAGIESLNQDSIYSLVLDSLCLLREGQGRIFFGHQIHRDYMAAVYLYDCLLDKKRISVWNEKQISAGIVQYLQYMAEEDFWREGGMADTLLNPYRGIDVIEGDCLVDNIINCWLVVETTLSRNLTDLDLRHLSLADHLKQPIVGNINLNNAKVSRNTFMNEKRHDSILALAFSHDCRILAAVSENGIVSITNIMTQNQRIVGQLGISLNNSGIKFGFDTEDHLILKYSDRTFVWLTISFDLIIEDSSYEIVSFPTEQKNITALERLEQRLIDSALMGEVTEASENGVFLAVGFESGYIQVWDVMKQDCIAYLSMGDSKIVTVSFTKDGKLAALGSGGKLVQIINLESGKCMRTLHFDKRISKVSFPGEKLGSQDNGMYLECRYSDGSYHKINLTDMSDTRFESSDQQLVSNTLLKRLSDMKYRKIKSAPNGNAIVLDTEKGNAFTWDEKLRQLNHCPGHMAKVSAIAICADTDSRFAASYSGERYQRGKGASKRDKMLNGEILVRVRIVKNGKCQWRLPTNGRKIEKLQFFTSNRIILAAFATNGDILMWELINKLEYGEERGRWDELAMIKNNQNNPVDCTVDVEQKNFISAYDDGTIVISAFKSGREVKKISTYPGIDLSRIQWETLETDPQTLETLERYRNN